MTIYILDNDPKLCAQYLDDKSLDKMIRDIAQVLCNIHHILINEDWGRQLYEDTSFSRLEAHNDVPLKENKICLWAEWARKCEANYLYLLRLGQLLCYEFSKRFNFLASYPQKIHESEKIIDWASDNVPDLPNNQNYFNAGADIYLVNGVTTPFPLVMPKKYADNLTSKDLEKLRYTFKLQDDFVCCYRNYYRAKLIKKVYWCMPRTDQALRDHGIKWTIRTKPEWVKL